MERRDFIQRSILATTAVSAAGLTVANATPQQNKELYELRVYEMRFGQAALDDFISKAFIPALNRLGVKNVGAFTEMGKSEPAKIYLLIPYSSLFRRSNCGTILAEADLYAHLPEHGGTRQGVESIWSRPGMAADLQTAGICQHGFTHLQNVS